ncbi:Dihydroflavonol-4-reductase [Orbilia brochopaga]|nr:Dihydroflavonol-4-reductase [Drechslerella brochopaga]
MEPRPEGHTFDESQWNVHSVTLCEDYKAGKSSNMPPPNESYRASKALAERALWDFVEKEKPSFEVAAINPTFVFGPVIHSVKDAESINTSVYLVFKYFAGINDKIEEGPAPKAYVDVRDVAEAHIKALEVEEAKGKRFLNCGGGFSWEEVVDVMRQHYPGKKFPEKTGEKVASYGFDNSQSVKVLGIKYISLEDTVLETVKSVEKFVSS